MTDMQEWHYRVVPKALLMIAVMVVAAFTLPPVPR